MSSEGSVTADKCITPLTPTCAPELWPQVNGNYNDTYNALLPFANLHEQDFAVITDFDAIMDAIENRPEHCVYGPINLGPNFPNPRMVDFYGQWDNYIDTDAGSHSLLWCLVDRAQGVIIARESWDGDVTFKWNAIDKQYFIDHAGTFFVALTKEEAAIARDIYVKVSVSSTPIGADCLLDNVKIGQTPCSVNILKGTTHSITVNAAGYVSQTQAIDGSMPTISIVLAPVPVPVVPWWKSIVDFILKLFHIG
jgi:hypothetical protein